MFPITMFPPIVPKDYFRTTGDLLPKIDQLVKDLEHAIFKLKQVKREAIKIKGDDLWLETTINENGEILFQKKNPREIK